MSLKFYAILRLHEQIFMMNTIAERATLIHSSLDSVSLALHSYLINQKSINVEPSSIRASLLQNGNIVNEQNKDKWKPKCLNKKQFRVLTTADAETRRHYFFQIILKKIKLDSKLSENEEFILKDENYCS